MPYEAVCLERKLFILEAKVDDVTFACLKVFKEMGLKVKNEEKS